MLADGSNYEHLSDAGSDLVTRFEWSPDGTRLALYNGQIYQISADGTQNAPITQTEVDIGGFFWLNNQQMIFTDTVNGWVRIDLDGSNRTVVNLDWPMGNFSFPPGIQIPIPPANSPPTADAGDDQVVVAANGVAAQVNLTASASDPEDEIEQLSWYQDGRQISTGMNPFQRDIELEVGVHVLTLVATDSRGLTGSDEVVITVVAPPSIQNGRIAFQANWDGDWEIYSINPDGSDLQQLTFNTVLDEYPAWSPDGSQIAYIHDGDLYVMQADGTDQQLLIETTNARHPVWSPDGTKIAFQQESIRFSDIYILDLSSMSVTNVTNTPDELDGSPDWSPDGTQIAFASNGDNPVPPPIDGDPLMDIFTINPDGTNRSLINISGFRIGNVNWTTENSIIFSVSGFELSSMYSVPVTGGEVTRISESDVSSYAPDLSPDHQAIVFVRENQIATMNLDGTDVVVLTNWTSRIAHPSWQPIIIEPTPTPLDETTSSVQGLLAYYEFNPLTESLEIRMRNYDTGEDTQILSDRYDNFSPTLSIEAQKIAFISDRDGDVEIYTINLDGSHLTQITTNNTRDFSQEWSPDGSQIVFMSENPNSPRSHDIYTVNSNGSNLVNLTGGVGNNVAPSWSADGNRIVFSSYRNGKTNIYYMDSDGQNLVQVTHDEDMFFSVPAFSPDGTKIAFAGTGGDYYVMNTDGTHVSRITQEADKGEFVWADHDTLLYESVQDGMTLINIDGSQRTPLGWFSPCECSRLTFGTLVINSPLITPPPE